MAPHIEAADPFPEATAVQLPVDGARLSADLTVPRDAHGTVIFAHGSGSSRFSGRNRAVAATLQHKGYATLLLDLLTPDEEREDEYTRLLRFDIPMLARRLACAADWVAQQREMKALPMAYFGASTGAAAALVAAGTRPQGFEAVVSRGGRPDLAGESLPIVQAATLLIVGGDDVEVLELNRRALAKLRSTKSLEIVPGASHLFEERGALVRVAALAVDWFDRYLRPHTEAPPEHAA
ncbi:MAG: dienelactone hydrolase family protein [Gemmatimonadetes bacterium]|nr:dienelactone hydrolase family protein [Gemmatimonadota bacterium]